MAGTTNVSTRQQRAASSRQDTQTLVEDTDRSNPDGTPEESFAPGQQQHAARGNPPVPRPDDDEDFIDFEDIDDEISRPDPQAQGLATKKSSKSVNIDSMSRNEREALIQQLLSANDKGKQPTERQQEPGPRSRVAPSDPHDSDPGSEDDGDGNSRHGDRRGHRRDESRHSRPGTPNPRRASSTRVAHVFHEDTPDPVDPPLMQRGRLMGKPPNAFNGNSYEKCRNFVIDAERYFYLNFDSFPLHRLRVETAATWLGDPIHSKWNLFSAGRTQDDKQKYLWKDFAAWLEQDCGIAETRDVNLDRDFVTLRQQAGQSARDFVDKFKTALQESDVGRLVQRLDTDNSLTSSLFFYKLFVRTQNDFLRQPNPQIDKKSLDQLVLQASRYEETYTRNPQGAIQPPRPSGPPRAPNSRRGNGRNDNGRSDNGRGNNDRNENNKRGRGGKQGGSSRGRFAKRFRRDESSSSRGPGNTPSGNSGDSPPKGAGRDACNACGKLGHWAKDCRSKPSSGTAPPGFTPGAKPKGGNQKSSKD
jgi:hypothetical protein